jgi:predicted acylesterase/phospholipase RssA
MTKKVSPPQMAVELLRRVPIFATIDDSKLVELARETRWLSLSAGDVLCRRGDPSEHVWVVLQGRVAVETLPGQKVFYRGVGVCLGEMGVLRQVPRSAELRAVRRTLVLEMTREQFLEFSRTHPDLLLLVAERLGDAVGEQSMAKPPPMPQVVAFVAGSRGAPLRRFAQLVSSRIPDAPLFTRDDALRARGRPEDDPGDEGCLEDLDKLGMWLGDCELRHPYVFLLADGEPTAWTAACIAFADTLVVVAEAAASLSLPHRSLTPDDNAPCRRVELVLVHPPSTSMPTGTGRWLDAIPVDTHHHVRLEVGADLERVARRLQGLSVSLVLGGGSARGLAHLGVLKALEELRIPVDMTCGTSIGAVVAGVCALGRSAAGVADAINPFFSTYSALLRPAAVPLVSTMSGLRMDKMCKTLFGDVHVEDTWVRNFSVASNLCLARPEVLDSGPLWFAVRASGSVPCLWPPVRHGDQVLVDGVVTNNLPGDLAVERQRGLTIAVNVIPREDPLFTTENVANSNSQWILRRLNVFGQSREPSLVDIGLRSLFMGTVRHADAVRREVDLFIEPDVGQFGFVFEKRRRNQIIEAGYRAAMESLTGWLEREPRVPRT